VRGRGGEGRGGEEREGEGKGRTSPLQILDPPLSVCVDKMFFD